MRVKTRILENGIAVNIQKEHNILYPSCVWEKLSTKTRLSIRDNLVYSKLASYSAILYKNIIFQSSKPCLKSFLDKCAVYDFPRFADEDGIPTKKLIKNFLNANFVFDGKDTAFPDENKDIGGGFVLGISFGKDSLLSYGIAEELALTKKLIFVKDFSDMEWLHKEKLMGKFMKEFGEEISILNDETDDIHRKLEINKIDSSGIFGSNAMNGYMLMLLPFAYHFGLKYIVFGNEQNFNDYFIDKEGFKTYPSYDQSSEWMQEQNKVLHAFTNNKIQISSFIEPLYNIAEVKILFRRYPKIAKYTMSCSHSEFENKENRWCNRCPMCAKAFLYLSANSFNQKIADFKENLFEKKHLKLYPLFNSKPERIYEKPKAVRDEQLFAFYLAYKNGFKGDLMELFKKKYLKEAKEREEELRKRFLGIHESKTLKGRLKKDVVSIFKEELE